MFSIFKKKSKKTTEDLALHILTLDRESLHIIIVDEDQTAQKLHQSLLELQNIGNILPTVIIATSKSVKSVKVESFSNKNDA
jgi:hypothetical protein